MADAIDEALDALERGGYIALPADYCLHLLYSILWPAIAFNEDGFFRPELSVGKKIKSCKP